MEIVATFEKNILFKFTVRAKSDKGIKNDIAIALEIKNRGSLLLK